MVLAGNRWALFSFWWEIFPVGSCPRTNLLPSVYTIHFFFFWGGAYYSMYVPYTCLDMGHTLLMVLSGVEMGGGRGVRRGEIQLAGKGVKENHTRPLKILQGWLPSRLYTRWYENLELGCSRILLNAPTVSQRNIIDWPMTCLGPNHVALTLNSPRQSITKLIGAINMSCQGTRGAARSGPARSKRCRITRGAGRL